MIIIKTQSKDLDLDDILKHRGKNRDNYHKKIDKEPWSIFLKWWEFQREKSLMEVSIIKEIIEENFPELKNILNLEKAHKVSIWRNEEKETNKN